MSQDSIISDALFKKFYQWRYDFPSPFPSGSIPRREVELCIAATAFFSNVHFAISEVHGVQSLPKPSQHLGHRNSFPWGEISLTLR